MCTYEARFAGDARRDFMGAQPAAFFYCHAHVSFSGNISRSTKTRLSAARPMPPHHIFIRRADGSTTLAGLRSPAHLFFHGESRQRLRSIFPVCRGPAVRTRLGTGIALQNSRVWLVDETLWQCAGARC